MKTGIRLAMAATVAVAGIIGISRFGGSTAGVAWGDVVSTVQDCQSSVARLTRRGPGGPEAVTIYRRSPARYRSDSYEGGELKRTLYVDMEAGMKLWLAHDAKVWFREAVSEQDAEAIRNEWTTPENYVERFLSGEYTELGRRDIDGTPCEGIEVTDPAVLQMDGPARAELWVSTETGYPVLVKVEIGSNRRETVVLDQLQWNAEFDAGEFEVEIPADYRPM